MLVRDPKQFPRTVLVSSSNVQHVGPALIVSISMSGSGATPDAQVYDGVNSNGEKKIDLRAIQDEAFSPFLGGPILCLTGIYAAVDASTTLLMITFYPLHEEQAEK